MFESLRKKAVKSSLALSILLFVIGIVLIAVSWKGAYYTVTGYADFSKISAEDLKGQKVDLEVTQNYGYYLERYERNTKTNTRKTTSYSCVIPTGDEEYFMGIKFPTSYEDEMDKILDSTIDGDLSESVSLSGTVRKMGSEEYKYFHDFFEDYFTDDEIDAITIPYYIDVTSNKLLDEIAFSAFFVIGIGLIVFGILRIVNASNGKTLKDLKNTISEAGMSESYAESDFNSAAVFTKNGDFRLGRIFTFYMQGSKPQAIINSKIQWVYQTTTTHRTNGIKTGTTYNLMVYVDGHKNPVSIMMPNEAILLEILRKIDAAFPWVVVGYTDELKKMYTKNRAEFLELRYNKVEHTVVEPF